MIGDFYREDPDDPRLPPGQAATERFPVLTYGPTPRVAREELELRVFGLAEPRSFRLDELLALPQSTRVHDFHCVTHWSRLGLRWTGVLTVDLVDRLSLHEGARHVMLHCYGGYTTDLPLDDFLADGCLLALGLDGDELPVEHGGPLRAVVPHLYGWKSAKWLSGIEFLAEGRPGFWERNGYHRRGDPWREERYG